MQNTTNQVDGDDLLDDKDDDETGDLLTANDPVVREKMVSTKAISLEELEALEDSSDEGGESVSGEMADVDSDDDLLLNSHAVGLRLDEDEDNPQPLDIAADIAAAEAERHGNSDAKEVED